MLHNKLNSVLSSMLPVNMCLGICVILVNVPQLVAGGLLVIWRREIKI